ncbi:amidohydrolase [Salarchaeum sp. III]|uniref:amidohydrolase n=1 Tax=Salarchaeum sp. III TaxID=3107927 RepID=UPI002ED92989
MTAAADLVLTNGEVHTLTDPDETYEAVAVRDGEIVRVDSDYEIDFLNGVETREIDLGGRVLLPGFVDAHVHMETVGRHRLRGDLRDATSPADAVDILRDSDTGGEWILGFGFDESTWDDSRYLTRDDLDQVSTERPVVAFREDLHTAALNGVALDRLRADLPESDVQTAGGEPTGVVVEDAAEVVRNAVEPGPAETADLLLAAQRDAHEKGVTSVHDMVRRSHAPRVYRELEAAGDLALRVRLNYWSDHLDAARELGLSTNHGSEFVRTGAIKTFTDGSLGGRTAKLSYEYADGDGSGQWVVPPRELHDLVRDADDAGFQLAVHAIGDEAIEETIDALTETDDPAGARHRIEHLELATDDQIERMADLGLVASMQPNFLKWSREGGLYDSRLGPARRDENNRFPAYLAAGVPLAFSSDSMPIDPLFGVHQTVNPPEETQRLSVTDALRAYTSGAAYAGFDEDRLGTVEVGKEADLVVLEGSPWERPGSIADIDVTYTIVDGEVVYEDR